MTDLLVSVLEKLVWPIIFGVIRDMLHLRVSDEEFRKQSDQVFAKILSAKSAEEAKNASKELQTLTSKV